LSPNSKNARAARLSDVAKLADVNVSTASRALNGDPRITAATRRRVERAVARLQYTINPVARSLSLSRTFTIGLLVGDLRNPFFADLARGVDETLHDAGYVYLVMNSGGDPQRQMEMARRLLERRVDALIVTVPHDPGVLAIKQVPVVAIDRSPIAGVPYVSVDNVEGGRLAVGHLIEAGYRHVGIIYGDTGLTPVADRLKGYETALRQAKIRPERALRARIAQLTHDEAYTAALALIDAGADSIFAIDDVTAVGALAAAADRSLRIPQQFGVVGYDDTPMAGWSPINLTSVAQSTVELGRQAARMALARIADPNAVIPPVILPPRLVLRRSSNRQSSRLDRSAPASAKP